jgi:hypothetical protein
MTSEGLGEVFKGDSAGMCVGKFRSCRWGDQQTVKRAQTVSKNPNRRERKYFEVGFHGPKVVIISLMLNIQFCDNNENKQNKSNKFSISKLSPSSN